MKKTSEVLLDTERILEIKFGHVVMAQRVIFERVNHEPVSKINTQLVRHIEDSGAKHVGSFELWGVNNVSFFTKKGASTVISAWGVTDEYFDKPTFLNDADLEYQEYEFDSRTAHAAFIMPTKFLELYKGQFMHSATLPLALFVNQAMIDFKRADVNFKPTDIQNVSAVVLNEVGIACSATRSAWAR